MGTFFGNIGHAVTKGVKDAGHAVGKGAVDAMHGVGAVADNKYAKIAAALALAGTGVGMGPAAAIMGGMGALGGAAKKGGGLKEGLKQGALGAGEGALAGLAGGGEGKAFGGLRAGFGKLGSMASTAAGTAVDGAKKVFNTGKNAVGNIVDGDEDKGGFDWTKLAKLGLAGTALYGQRQATNAANDYQNKMLSLHQNALDSANADYASRAPLRAAASDKLSTMLTKPRASDVTRRFLNG